MLYQCRKYFIFGYSNVEYLYLYLQKYTSRCFYKILYSLTLPIHIHPASSSKEQWNLLPSHICSSFNSLVEGLGVVCSTFAKRRAIRSENGKMQFLRVPLTLQSLRDPRTTLLPSSNQSSLWRFCFLRLGEKGTVARESKYFKSHGSFEILMSANRSNLFGEKKKRNHLQRPNFVRFTNCLLLD